MSKAAAGSSSAAAAAGGSSTGSGGGGSGGVGRDEDVVGTRLTYAPEAGLAAAKALAVFNSTTSADATKINER